ncbi:MAG: type II secretion system protein GspD, partial [Anaerolineaceae bacterium]|nr:type II secretion system protein GspD [Anaerolineaceae bacterium]
MTQATTRCGLIILLAAVLSACAMTRTDSGTGATAIPEPVATSLELVSRATPKPLAEVPERPREKVTLIPGTGNFINTRAATRPVTQSFARGEVTLNFEAADLREVVKVVFDTLGQNYIIDPQVQGVVTIQTSRPVPKQTLLSTLDTLLQMNGATMVQADGVYRIIPISNAVAGNTSPRLGQTRLNPGFNIRVVPLRYVSATEMEKMLTPFAPQGSILNVDPGRNILTLSGTENELAVLQETIDIFDVNWMQGMSFGIFRLQNVDSQAMAENLTNLFGEESKMPMAGMLRFIPVQQLNSVVVITPQIAYLNEIGKWVERLDGTGGERLYVYPVQNGSAEYLAEVLSQLFGSG